jgi:NAD(P)H dehydrogenase (quinone)
MASKIKVFVIGATGTTGAATVRALRAAGIDVIAGVHSLEKACPQERLGAVVRHFDFANVAEMTSAMAGADRLF